MRIRDSVDSVMKHATGLHRKGLISDAHMAKLGAKVKAAKGVFPTPPRAAGGAGPRPVVANGQPAGSTTAGLAGGAGTSRGDVGGGMDTMTSGPGAQRPGLAGGGYGQLSASGGDKTAAVSGNGGPPATSRTKPRGTDTVDTVTPASAPSWGNPSAPTKQRKVMTGA